MGVVLAHCPDTDRDFSTGIHLEESTFRMLPDVVVQSRCPYCKQWHGWRKAEAKFAASIPRAQQREAQAAPNGHACQTSGSAA